MLLSASLLLGPAISPLTAEAKKSARRATSGGGGGGGGGGVYLNTPNPTTPLEWNNRAVELGNKGLWADAIKHHEEAIRMMNPFTVEYDEFKRNLSGACLRYGDRLASQKKWYEAGVQYRKALYADPNNEQADRQLDMCLKASGKNPDDPGVRHNLGETAETDGRFGTAIVEYRKVVKMKDDGPSHYDLARALRKEGGIKDIDALSELKIAVNKPWSDKNELAKCHCTLADLLWDYANRARERGNRETALKRLSNAGIEYRRAVTINPALSDAIQGLKEVARESVAINPSFENHMMLAGAYQLAGDFPHAKMEYEECWKKNPGHPALPKARRSFAMAVVASPLAGDAEVMTTVKKIEDMLKQNNNDAEMLWAYGRGKERLGDKSTAVQAYMAAYKINPYAHPDLPQGIGRLTGSTPGTPVASAATGGSKPGPGAPSSASGKPEAAPVVPEKPKEPIKDPQRFAQVQSKMRSGDVEGALKDLQELTTKDPADSEAWFLMGTTQQKKGDLDSASACFRQAFYLKHPEARDAMRLVDTSRIQPLKTEAEKQEQSGNWVGAASSWREACTLAPMLPLPHRKLGEALKQLADASGAERERKKADDLEKDDKK